MLREAAAATTRITGDVIPSDKPGLMSMALRQPLGVVLGIAPSNGDFGRAGTAGDVAPAIVFLCSDGRRWISGVNLPVDGGVEAFVSAEAYGFSG